MEQEYNKGIKNGLIRWYFYLLNGVNAVSDFRNIVLGIFGLYFTLKLTNPILMGLMFLGSVIILAPTGYFMVHKVNKVKEWLGTKFGSHYAIKNFNYVEEQYKLTLEIRDLLKKLNEHNN